MNTDDFLKLYESDLQNISLEKQASLLKWFSALFSRGSKQIAKGAPKPAPKPAPKTPSKNKAGGETAGTTARPAGMGSGKPLISETGLGGGTPRPPKPKSAPESKPKSTPESTPAPAPESAPAPPIEPMSPRKAQAHLTGILASNLGGKLLAPPISILGCLVKGTGNVAKWVGGRSIGNAIRNAGNAISSGAKALSGEMSRDALVNGASPVYRAAGKWMHRLGNIAFYGGLGTQTAQMIYDYNNDLDLMTGTKFHDYKYAQDDNGNYIFDKNGIPVIGSLNVTTRGTGGKIISGVNNVINSIPGALLPRAVEHAAALPYVWLTNKVVEGGVKLFSGSDDDYTGPSQEQVNFNKVRDFVANNGGNITVEQIAELTGQDPGTALATLSKNFKNAYELDVPPYAVPDAFRNLVIANNTVTYRHLKEYGPPGAAEAYLKEVQPWLKDIAVTNFAAYEDWKNQSTSAANQQVKNTKQPTPNANTSTPTPQEQVANPTTNVNTPASTPQVQPTNHSAPNVNTPAPKPQVQTTNNPSGTNPNANTPGGKTNWTPWALGIGSLALLAGGAMLFNKGKEHQRKKKIEYVESQIRKGKMTYLQAEKYLNDEDE